MSSAAVNRTIRLALMLGAVCALIAITIVRWRAFQTTTIARQRNIEQLSPNLPHLERERTSMSRRIVAGHATPLSTQVGTAPTIAL